MSADSSRASRPVTLLRIRINGNVSMYGILTVIMEHHPGLHLRLMPTTMATDKVNSSAGNSLSFLTISSAGGIAHFFSFFFFSFQIESVDTGLRQ